MKSREVLVRLHRFKVEGLQRRMKGLADMRQDLARKSTDLETMLQEEQKKAAATDLGRLTYPSFVRAVMARRENIQKTIDELERQSAALTEELQEAFRELKKYEVDAENARMRERVQDARREQSALDETALAGHIRSAAQNPDGQQV